MEAVRNCHKRSLSLFNSQFLILPPHVRHGHGSKSKLLTSSIGLFRGQAILNVLLLCSPPSGIIYNAIYKDLLARQEVVSITVESPNEAFSALRDHCDLRHLMTDKTLKQIPIPFGIDLIHNLTRMHKLHKVGDISENHISPNRIYSFSYLSFPLSFIQMQILRCCEILAFRQLINADVQRKKAYRLEVKKRLRRLYEDQLEGMEKQEIHKHLEDLYQEIEEEYRRILSHLGGS